MIADFNTCDTFAECLNDAAALMAENRGKLAFGIVPRQGERIGVADARSDDAHQYFASPRRFQVDFLYAQRLARAPGDGRASFKCFHATAPPVTDDLMSMWNRAAIT